jgi:DNA-binding winged helix-turn-helix (wHTH) protein
MPIRDSQQGRIRFGLFELDRAAGELHRRGLPVRIQDQPFKILSTLLERPGEVVTRDELRHKLWPADTFVVFDESLNTAIRKLRYALGDSADNPTFVETVPRRGYRFIAPVDVKVKEGGSQGGSLDSSRTFQPTPQSVAGDPLAIIPMLPLSNSQIDGAVRTARPSLFLVVGAVLVFAVSVIAAAWVGSHHLAKIPEADFSRLSFGRGLVRAARFAADGRSVIYSATWDADPVKLFSVTVSGGRGTQNLQSLGLNADILAVGPSGQMAVLLEPHFGAVATIGTLAIVPSGEHTTHKLMEDVQDASWSGDGSRMVITHYSGDRCSLELLPGKTLYATSGGAWLSHPRFSSQGDKIAFLEHPFADDDSGFVAIVDLTGKKLTISRQFEGIWGLAWDPRDGKIWIAGMETAARGVRSLYKLTTSGQQELVFPASGFLTLHDVSGDGHLLLTRETWRGEVFGRIYPSVKEQELGWLDNSFATDISNDGTTVLLAVQSEGASKGYDAYIRRTDGSAARKLGEGLPTALSPDGKSALGISPWGLRPAETPEVMQFSEAQLSRTLTHDALSHQWATWLPNGNSVLHQGNEAGHRQRDWVQDIRTGQTTAITPEGTAGNQVSPDGKYVVAMDSERQLWLFPLMGGEPRKLLGIEDGEKPIRWSADGTSLFVANSKIPVEIYRVEIANARRHFLYRLAPTDRAGVSSVTPVLVTPDGRSYVYSYSRAFGDLYIVKGLQ